MQIPEHVVSVTLKEPLAIRAGGQGCRPVGTHSDGCCNKGLSRQGPQPGSAVCAFCSKPLTIARTCHMKYGTIITPKDIDRLSRILSLGLPNANCSVEACSCEKCIIS